MYNTFQTYQDTLNDFEFLQIYSSLEHLQRQINNINYQMYQNRYNNPTFYRNHYYRHPNTNRTRNSQTSSFNLNSTSDPNLFQRYTQNSNRTSIRRQQVPESTSSQSNLNTTRERVPTSSASASASTSETTSTSESNFRSLLDNLFNLNDMRNVGSMEISVRNSNTDPNLFRDIFGNNSERQTSSTFRDIEDNTEIEVLDSEEPEQDICVICREQFQSNDIIRRVKKCKHYFHLSCSNTWFNNNMTCPLCRQCIIIENTDDNENSDNNVHENENDNVHENENDNVHENENRRLSDNTMHI